MGRHQPLRVWIGCLYLMGLNLSHQQIAQELDLHKDDVHAMTPQLRCSLLCLWLRPHRGISQENLPLYLGFFTWASLSWFTMREEAAKPCWVIC